MIVLRPTHCVFTYQTPNQVFVNPSAFPSTSPTYTYNSPLFTVSTTHLPLSLATREEPNPLYRTMSREFLTHLLSTTENRVRSDQGANCMICLEDYNTLNTLTGVVEWEVDLPCGHRVGSSCIVTWLQANNNCPACRKKFFPTQPRPHLEHGIMDAGGARATTVQAPIRGVVPTARTGSVPATTHRVVLKGLMAEVRDCTIALISTILGIGFGIYMATHPPDFLVSLWSPSPSAGPAYQAKRCMDWQDCSFLTAPSA